MTDVLGRVLKWKDTRCLTKVIAWNPDSPVETPGVWRVLKQFLVDSNIILDIVTEDPQWFEWSVLQLGTLSNSNNLVINPIIYAEVSIAFEQVEELEAALPTEFFRRDALPWEAGFLAGRSFLQYRRRGGERRSPLPDFYIGAHAAFAGFSLLTRDVNRYRTYFPELVVIAPS